MLLKADANGPNWTDTKIAEAFSCRTKTVENVRQRLVTVGFASALHREKPQTPPRQKQLDGEQEVQVIALRLGKPPKGFANWSLRLLAEQVVELAIVDAVSHETLRKMLKKTMIRQKARNHPGTDVLVRPATRGGVSWNEPGASSCGDAGPDAGLQEPGDGDRAINPHP